MRWLKWQLAILVLLGIAFAAGNIWIAAVRTLVPLDLDETITEKETRREKHPGVDEVYLLHFESGRTLQVEAEIHNAVEVGSRIQKERGESLYFRDGGITKIKESKDLEGMRKAMPGILIVMILSVVYSRQRL